MMWSCIYGLEKILMKLSHIFFQQPFDQMASKDEHIDEELSEKISMTSYETVYSKPPVYRFFRKEQWKGILAIVVATGLFFEFAAFGLSLHCEFKPKTDRYLDFFTRSNEETSETQDVSTRVESDEISNYIFPYTPPMQPYQSLCKYQTQYRLTEISNKIVTICSIPGDDIRIDLRVFLHHKPTRIGIYLSPTEFHSLAGLYDTILQDINAQIFMLENEPSIDRGLNLTTL